MLENPLDELRRFDARDDPKLAAAAPAGLDLPRKDALESLCLRRIVRCRSVSDISDRSAPKPVDEEVEPEKPKKKRGFWSRLFGRGGDDDDDDEDKDDEDKDDEKDEEKIEDKKPESGQRRKPPRPEDQPHP